MEFLFMLKQNEIKQLLESLTQKQIKLYKKFIQQGYTLEQAKIKYKENTRSSKYYWIARGYSQEEASLKINANNPTHTYYWISRGYTEEQAQLKIRQRKKKCIEYWLTLYQPEQAKIKYEQYMKQVSPTCVEFWLRKGYTQEQSQLKIKEFSQKTSKRISKQYKKSYTKTCKEYWIANGYTQEEAIIKAKQHNRNMTKNISRETRSKATHKYLNNMTQQQKLKYDQKNKQHSQRMKAKNKTHSPIFLQYWINKGYTQQQAKIQVQNIKFGDRKDGFASKIQNKCFIQLQQFLHIQLKLQKWITINKSNYCIDAKYNNFVFQFNGTNFHLDPRFYNESSHNPKGVSYNDVKQKDNKKINDYKNKHFNIIIIWEYDYINNKEKLFEYIKKEIQNEQNCNAKDLYWDSSCIFNECRRYS